MNDRLNADPTAGLALLRKPFEPHQISKLPKPTKQQTEALRADYKIGVRCDLCGAWHAPKVVHLDYVGHAALTDRLLDADPMWTWEPLAYRPDGLPMLDAHGGMWIKLTVCGVTRFGYGDAADKTGPNAVKECIGDALRNAAMRFGAALDLWHKGDLHPDSNDDPPPAPPPFLPPQNTALPAYSASAFTQNLPSWKNLIVSGKKTTDQIIKTISSKGTLTEAQKKTIQALATKQPQPDPQFVAELEAGEHQGGIE